MLQLIVRAAIPQGDSNMRFLTRIRSFFQSSFVQINQRPRKRAFSREQAACIERLEQKIALTAVTGAEQYFLELINRGRANPTAEATREGIALNEGLPAGTISTSPKQPLALNDALQAAIEGHLQDEITHNYFSHTGSDGTNPDQRMKAAGYTNPFFDGENLAWEGTTASGTLNLTEYVNDEYNNLFIDSGEVGRGHRTNMMDPNFQEVGSGVKAANPYQGYNSVLVGNDFGVQGGNEFVTGVAYTDRVTANSFYDIGEGLGGASVVVKNSSTGATFSTTTNAAGGYQIDIPAGSYTITFSGAGFASPLVKSFTISNLNVKVDANTRTDVSQSGPPVLAGTNPQNYTQNGAPVAIDSAITVADTGRTTLANATITVSNFVAGQDVLGFTPNAATMGNITVTSNASGVLKLSSAGSTATLLQWQTALRSVTYSNTSSTPSTTTRNVTFAVDDGAATNHASNVLQTTVSVTAVNNAPVLSGVSTSSLAYTENQAATAIAPAIVITDANSPNMSGATVKFTANYTAGQDRLAYTNVAGITGSFNTTSGVMTFTGTATLTAYQTILRSVTYQNISDNPNVNARTVSFVVTDSSANSSAAVSRSISVLAVNDPPVLSAIETSTLSYTVGAAPVAVTSTLLLTDPDSLTIAGATVSITGAFQANADVLKFSNTAKITGSYNPQTGVLTLTGADSGSNYRTALRSIAYSNTSASAMGGTRTIVFRANDGATVNNLSKTVSRNINVTAGVPPVLGGVPGTTLAYTENASATALAPAITVTDSGSATLTGATVQITGNYSSGPDRLSAVSSGGVTATFNATTGTLSLTGTASLAAYQTVLRTVTFQNISDNPSTLIRTVSFVATDAKGNSNIAVTRTVTITAVNDAPHLLGIETTNLSYAPLQAPVAISSTIVVTEPDDPTISSVTITIGGTYQQGADVLSFVNTATIHGTFNAATGTMTLSGSDTGANYRAAIRSVTFSNTTGAPTAGQRVISIQANDGHTSNNLSNIVTRNINVT